MGAYGEIKQSFIQAKLLTSWGLSPMVGYERRTKDVDVLDGIGWLDHLRFIIPYLEEFGMERALRKTRHYNGDTVTASGEEVTEK